MKLRLFLSCMFQLYCRPLPIKIIVTRMSGKTYIKAYDRENLTKERTEFQSVFVRFSNDKQRKITHLNRRGKFNKFSLYYAILLFCWINKKNKWKTFKWKAKIGKVSKKNLLKFFKLVEKWVNFQIKDIDWKWFVLINS